MNIYILNRQLKTGEVIQLRAFMTEAEAKRHAHMNETFLQEEYIYFITEIPLSLQNHSLEIIPVKMSETQPEFRKGFEFIIQCLYDHSHSLQSPDEINRLISSTKLLIDLKSFWPREDDNEPVP